MLPVCESYETNHLEIQIQFFHEISVREVDVKLSMDMCCKVCENKFVNTFLDVSRDQNVKHHLILKAGSAE